jgi:hypothetical protein
LSFSFFSSLDRVQRFSQPYRTCVPPNQKVCQNWAFHLNCDISCTPCNLWSYDTRLTIKF